MKKLLAVILVLIPVVVFALGEGGIQGGGSGGGTTNASDLSSGTVAAARLGSGTPDNTTFLRGDSAWAAPTATVADGSITGAKIADNTIKNADIASDAAIAATKIDLSAYAPLVSPTFTSPTLGVATATTLNTGQGAYELYAMDQNVRTTDNVTFNVITFNEAVSTCVPADNNCGSIATNVGSPAGANLSAGLQWFDNTTQCFMVRNNDNTVNITMSCLTKTFQFGIDNVVTSDDILLWKVPRALTITQVDCYASTDNVVGVLSECLTDNVASCTAVDSTDWTITNAVTGFSVNTGFENPGIAAGAWLKWITTSVGTTNSNKLSCTVQYRE